ncbi:MAG: hypothetical protein WED00_08550 [Aquisalimonadaceae bacterium]
MGKYLARDYQQALPSFLDLEASSLNPLESYPTEVAWSLPNGSIHSHLVYPEPDWEDWNPVAERLTGISRSLIESHGLAPARVADALNRDLAGSAVYCDGGYYDQAWLSRLFKAANRSCRFTLLDISLLLPAPLGATPHWPETLQALAQRAREESGPAHRADRDVAYLIRFYALVRAELD